MTLANDIHFVKEPGGAAELVHQEQDVADVYADAPLQVRLKHDVAGHRLPVAVKSKADQFSLCVQYRAAGVAAGNIVVGKEASRQVAGGIGIDTVVLGLPKLLQACGDDKFIVGGVFLLHYAVKGGEMVVPDAVLGRIAANLAVSKTHGEVCIGIRRLAGLPLKESCGKCLGRLHSCFPVKVCVVRLLHVDIEEVGIKNSSRIWRR